METEEWAELDWDTLWMDVMGAPLDTTGIPELPTAAALATGVSEVVSAGTTTIEYGRDAIDLDGTLLSSLNTVYPVRSLSSPDDSEADGRASWNRFQTCT